MINDGEKVLQSFEGLPLYTEDKGLVVGELASFCVEMEEDPIAKWNGGTISADVLHQCAAFSLFCGELFGGEVQGRLYYCRATGEWATSVVEQFVSTTLESKETGREGNIEYALTKLPKGKRWNQMGTWHSHAMVCSAHQSPTDLKDEIKQNGVHITFGILKDEEYDVHTRITHNGINYDLGNGIEHGVFAEDYKPLRADHKSEFPDWWCEQLVERPVRVRPVAKKGSTTTQHDQGDLFPRIEISDEELFKFVSLVKETHPGEDIGSVLGAVVGKWYTSQYKGPDESGATLYECQFCSTLTTDADLVCDDCYKAYS
jgi:hypothetical protein